MAIQPLIQKITQELDTARQSLEDAPNAEAIKIGMELSDTVFGWVNTLKADFRNDPASAEICEQLANFYLDCGHAFFEHNRNATATVDKMHTQASLVTKGLDVSADIKRKLDDAYRSWHWHGW